MGKLGKAQDIVDEMDLQDVRCLQLYLANRETELENSINGR